jgi:RNA polymerase sigma factor FliA
VEHLDLVEIATKSLRSPSAAAIDRDDLIAEGQLALVTAARRYDPRKGGFRGYALPRIRGAMIDALRRNHLLPRSAWERGSRLHVLSMDKPVESGAPALVETLVDDKASVEDIVTNREQLAEVVADLEQIAESPALRLTPSELEVLRGAAVGETAVETAQRLSKSTETVKSQRRAAIRRLGARSIAHAVFMARDEIAA